MPLIERVDRMQLAVHDRAAAEETFQRLFGAERARLDESAHLNAWRTILSIGESERRSMRSQPISTRRVRRTSGKAINSTCPAPRPRDSRWSSRRSPSVRASAR
jgi:hypothetical protein